MPDKFGLDINWQHRPMEQIIFRKGQWWFFQCDRVALPLPSECRYWANHNVTVIKKLTGYKVQNSILRAPREGSIWIRSPSISSLTKAALFIIIMPLDFPICLYVFESLLSAMAFKASSRPSMLSGLGKPESESSPSEESSLFKAIVGNPFRVAACRHRDTCFSSERIWFAKSRRILRTTVESSEMGYVSGSAITALMMKLIEFELSADVLYIVV